MPTACLWQSWQDGQQAAFCEGGATKASNVIRHNLIRALMPLRTIVGRR